jgi:hypothetical protein
MDNFTIERLRTLDVVTPPAPEQVLVREFVPPTGVKETTMQVGDLNDSELHTLCELWAAGLLAIVDRQRKQPKEG